MFPIASENSKGYFNAAIVQSGPLDMGLILTDKSKVIPEIHKEFVKNVGCRHPDVIKCLQQKSAKDLMANFQLRDECNCKYLKSNFSHNEPIQLLNASHIEDCQVL